MIVEDKDRIPPKPTLAYGRCAFCGELGPVVVRQFYQGGTGYVFHAVCLEPVTCQERTIAAERYLSNEGG